MKIVVFDEPFIWTNLLDFPKPHVVHYFRTQEETLNFLKKEIVHLLILPASEAGLLINQYIYDYFPQIIRVFGNKNEISEKHKKTEEKCHIYFELNKNNVKEFLQIIMSRDEDENSATHALANHGLNFDSFKNNINMKQVINSQENTAIQNKFNELFLEMENSMSENQNPKNPQNEEDDEEGKATVVLDMSKLKAELAAQATANDNPEPVDLDFGSSDGGIDLGASVDTSLQMDDIQAASVEETADADVGLDVSLDLDAAFEVTGSNGDSVPTNTSAVEEPALEIDDSLMIAPDDGKSPFDANEDIGSIMAEANNVAESEPEAQNLDESFSEEGALAASNPEDEQEVGFSAEAAEALDFSMPEETPEVETEEPAMEMVSDDIAESEGVEIDDSLLAGQEEEPVAAAPEITKTKVVTKLPPKAPVIKAPVIIAQEVEPEVEEEISFSADDSNEVVEEELAPLPVAKKTEVKKSVKVSKPARENVVQQTVNTNQLKQDHDDYIEYHDDELIRLAATIRNLRDDRESLIEKISKLEQEKDRYYQDYLSNKAEIDDKKIEITLMKKRYSDETSNLKYQLALSEEKRSILEEKNKFLKQELERLSGKVRLDFKKIQNRERELENQLELLKSDSEVQVRNRDQKILDLKRKIDMLEFDVENMGQKETENKNSQAELEGKLDRAINTLRSAISTLEGGDTLEEKFELLKKKNLNI